ncbi:RNA-directed DNA polymerase from mobile element jockey [Trichonephila clavipes]|nr:RNA-directed DNA polymerase from mobile element jockey [Trichonephila clavipes]
MLALSRMVSLFGSVPPSATLCSVCRAPFSQRLHTFFRRADEVRELLGRTRGQLEPLPKHPNNAKRKNQNKNKNGPKPKNNQPNKKTVPQVPRTDISKARKVSPNLDYSKVVQNLIPREHVSPPLLLWPPPTPAPSKDASVNAGLLKDLLVIIEDTPCIDNREIAKDIQSHSRTQWEKHIEALLPDDNTLWRKSSLLRKPFRSIPPLQGALGSTAITPIEKAEVIADSLREQFEPNHVAGREEFDQRIHAEVENFLATPHVQEIEPTTPTEVFNLRTENQAQKIPRT